MRARRDPGVVARLIDQTEDAALPGHGLAEREQAREASDQAEQRALAEGRPM